jgi:hypothetical protein
MQVNSDESTEVAVEVLAAAERAGDPPGVQQKLGWP